MPEQPPPTFATERTRELRNTDLKVEDERTLTHIEQYGCSVLTVGRSSETYGLNWTYTIGAYDTSGVPELITVGLSPSTAQSALNAAVNLARNGADLTQRRHR